MPDSDHSENTQKEIQEPNGTTLSVEEWIEVLNKHDSFDQYAKKRRKNRED